MRSFMPFKSNALMHTIIVSVALFLVALAPVRAAVAIQEVSSTSGVTAWLVEDHTLPIITFEFSFEGGTAQDPEGKEGVANLLSSLFDEGAGDLDSEAFQKRMDDLGAEMSFRATSDALTGRVRMLTDNRDAVLELVKAALIEPRFDHDAVERMRSQTAASIRSDERDPNYLGGQKLSTALYGEHPYARPRKGTLETLTGISQDDLHAAHKRLVARSNLTIGVVGAITADDLATALDTVFGDLPELAELAPVADIEPKLSQEVRVEYPMPQTSIQLVYPGVKQDDPEFFAAYLMNGILGGTPFTSRLWKEVREKRGLAYGVSTYLSGRDYAQSLRISTGTSGEQVEQALSVIEDVIADIRENGVTEEELEATKLNVIGAYAIQNLDSSTSIARTLVGLQEYGHGIDYIERRAELISAVTLEEVNAAARKLLSADPAILIVGPAEQSGGE